VTCYVYSNILNGLLHQFELAINGLVKWIDQNFGEESLMVYKFVCCVFIFNLNKKKHAASREMERKCSNLQQGTLGNAAKSSLRSFE
jgi:hypothetical protein